MRRVFRNKQSLKRCLVALCNSQSMKCWWSSVLVQKWKKSPHKVLVQATKWIDHIKHTKIEILMKTFKTLYSQKCCILIQIFSSLKRRDRLKNLNFFNKISVQIFKISVFQKYRNWAKKYFGLLIGENVIGNRVISEVSTIWMSKFWQLFNFYVGRAILILAMFLSILFCLQRSLFVGLELNVFFLL